MVFNGQKKTQQKLDGRKERKKKQHQNVSTYREKTTKKKPWMVRERKKRAEENH